MKLYALISGNNSVTGLIQAEDDSHVGLFASIYSQVIDVSDVQPTPQIGWSFDGTNIVGTSASKRITILAMRQRFTVSEMLAIMTAAETTQIVRYLMKNLELATFVDLSRSDTQAGIGVLVSYGLITQERANIILTAPPALHEVYSG